MSAASEQAADLEGDNVLDLRGSRGIVDEAKAKELMSAVAERQTAFDTAVLSTRSITPPASCIVAEELAKLPLRRAIFSDCISGIPEKDAFETLNVLCAALKGKDVEELDLSDNALGIKGIRACQPALEAPAALRRLYLCNDGISAEACELIHDLLLQGAGESGNCPLTALHFFNNMSGEGGGLAIGKLLARCSAMESFRMSSTRCTPAGGAAILRGLQATSALRTLDLSDNTLGTESGPLVADLLRAQPGLASLHLGDTSLEASGVVEVADALATSCPALTYLNLSCNESGADGALALARALRQGTPQLKELHMEENELGSRGAKAVARAVHGHPALLVLRLGENEIGARAAQALADCAVACPALQELHVDGNWFSEEAVTTLESALAAADRASVLQSMEDNDEDGEEEEATPEEEAEDAEWDAEQARRQAASDTDAGTDADLAEAVGRVQISE